MRPARRTNAHRTGWRRIAGVSGGRQGAGTLNTLSTATGKDAMAQRGRPDVDPESPLTAGPAGSAQSSAVLPTAHPGASASVLLDSGPETLDLRHITPQGIRLGRLWQFPLLVVSVGLFGYAGYKLLDLRPGPTIDQRIESAGKLLANDHAEAATEVLRQLLLEDQSKLSGEQKGQIQLTLARSVEQVQRSRRLDLRENHQRIVEYTAKAEQLGVKLTASDYRTLAESNVSLGKPHEALEAFGHAIDLDPERALPLRRKVVELLIAEKESLEAEEQLEHILSTKDLPQQERSWAVGEKSRLLVDRLMFKEARDLLAESLHGEQDPSVLGTFNYRLGYCEWKLGNKPEAERLLRLARQQLRSSQPEDSDAALLLGKLLAEQGKHAEAISFFQAVLANDPGHPAAIPALLGRGSSRLASGQVDAGVEDLTSVVRQIVAKPSMSRYRDEALQILRQSSRILTDQQHLKLALELLTAEQDLEPAPSAEFFARLSAIYEKRAAELATELAKQPEGPARVKAWQLWRDTLTQAGDAAIANSNGLVVHDDRGYGEALWRGIDLYDRAGALAKSIGALELFVAERPDDPLAPDALLRLGRAYHAAGQFDKAVAAFQRNQFRYAQSLAAQKSGVPLARSYIAKGPAGYAKAEQALKATLESPLITPEAEEFREALFEMAQLYYRTDRYEEAGEKLDELVRRYPADERMAQLKYLMGDSLRKSAALLTLDLASQSASRPASEQDRREREARQQERSAQRRDRLTSARKLYDDAIERYRQTPPKSDLDKLYLKLAHFYRADCLFDNGDYEEAVRLYDVAALRYQDDPSALAAYVQIVNAYAALGRPADARAANERAHWLLQRMPPDAFRQAQLTMPQVSWESWVTWTKAVGATAASR